LGVLQCVGWRTASEGRPYKAKQHPDPQRGDNQSWRESRRYTQEKGGQDDMNEKWEEKGYFSSVIGGEFH
jgi:hypothetical protein